MVVFVFHVPAQAYLLQHGCGRFFLAAAQVDSSAFGVLAGFFTGRLTLDLGNRTYAGEVDLQGVDRHEPDRAGIDASVAEFYRCVQKGGAVWLNLRVTSSSVVFWLALSWTRTSPPRS